MLGRSTHLNPYVSRKAQGVVPLTMLSLDRLQYGLVYKMAPPPGAKRDPELTFPLSEGDSSSRVTVIRLFSLPRRSPAGPKEELARFLLELRQSAVSTGTRLLSREEVLEEVRSRRGELENSTDDANLS